MTALAADRSTIEKHSPAAMQHEQGVAASAVIFNGALLVVDANGFIAPGTATTGLVAAGSALEGVDNSGGANGDLNVKFRSGIFKYVNDGATAVVQADVGSDCFILDDQTVSGDGTGRSRAGMVYKLDVAADVGGAGVWVAIAFPLGA